MKIVFRVDASLQIGTGHVMRCLTLADVLKQKGAEVSFICREHAGNLISFIQEKGFNVHALAKVSGPADFQKNDSKLFHAEWLGASQEQDAQACQPLLEKIHPDWVIVDHYAIDQTWQACLKPTYKKLMVIDDLGDRHHICDLLLDQNYGSSIDKYQRLVPKHCKILAGTQYALLRPEFKQWRAYSLQRRENSKAIKTILVTLGGVDSKNCTEQVLQQLASLRLDSSLEVVVVMGKSAPYLDRIKTQANKMPIKTLVKIDISNMAELMYTSDIAIGAAGATTWERCCLGLPTIQLILAENQREIATSLEKIGAAVLLEKLSDLGEIFQSLSLEKQKCLTKVSKELVDGQGSHRVVCELMGKWNGN